MTTVTIGDDDIPVWSGIKRPWSRISNAARYLRAELGHVMCRRFGAASAVTCECPVMDEDGDTDGCVLTIKPRGDDCNAVSLSCSGDHSSREIVDAIIPLLDG